MTELWHDAFLLHQRPYGNTSVIAEMFTLENGRISVIARGAKKPKSKFKTTMVDRFLKSCPFASN